MGIQVVRVVVDVHEPSAIRSEIERLGADVVVESLRIGDYRTSDALVERKTVRDLHLTLVAGRLWGQLGRLRRSGPPPFLLVEGSPLDVEAVLAAIPNISTVSACALLAHFGSIEAIINATEADVTAVTGVGPIRARNLREALSHPQSADRSRRSRG